MTDGLEQYHKLARDQEGITNANCMAHARRHFANAIKAAGQKGRKSIQSSIAYQALVRIGAIYELEKGLKNLSAEERLGKRQASIRPLVEEYFAWVKETLSGKRVLPKGETAKGLKYSLNQEEYLKVFLTDGEVPIDDSASERALRNFTIGRKNWVTVNTVRGVQASAVIYSITETARERAECLLLPQASADGTAAVAAVPRKAGGICAGAAHAVVKGTAGRML